MAPLVGVAVDAWIASVVATGDEWSQEGDEKDQGCGELRVMCSVHLSRSQTLDQPDGTYCGEGVIMIKFRGR